MSDLMLCGAMFVFFVSVLCLFMILWRKTRLNTGPMPRTAWEALRLFTSADTWADRLFVVFLCSPIFARGGFLTALVALSAAGFACIASLCTPWLGSPKFFHEILANFYRSMREILSPLRPGTQVPVPKQVRS